MSIKEYRKQKGYSQIQLANLVGITLRQMQRIENNECDTSLKTLRKLIVILEISDNDILSYINNK